MHIQVVKHYMFTAVDSTLLKTCEWVTIKGGISLVLKRDTHQIEAYRCSTDEVKVREIPPLIVTHSCLTVLKLPNPTIT